MGAARQRSVLSLAGLGVLATGASLSFGVACSTFDAAPATSDGGPDASPGDDGATVFDVAQPDGGDAGLSGSEVVATGQIDVTSLLVTPNYLYWSENGEGSIRRVRLASLPGGSPEVFVSTAGTPHALRFRSDMGLVVWADGSNKHVASAPESTASVSILFTTTGAPLDFVSNSSGAWFITANGDVHLKTVDADVVKESGNNPFAITSLNDVAYWSQSGAATIRSSAGTNVGTLATPENDCQSITATKTGIYWAKVLEGEIRGKVPNGAGSITVANNQTGPFSVTGESVSEDLYWLTISGELRKKTTTQSSSDPPLTLTSGLHQVAQDQSSRVWAYAKNIALTPTHVYFVSWADHTILRRSR